MQKLLYILLFLLFALKGNSQNLIPNGDFELGPDSSSAEWYYYVDSTCTQEDTVFGPDFWTVVDPSPDRLIEGDIPCNWDNDTAQSGKAYIVLGFLGPGESGKTTLISPLEKDSIYQLSYYLSLETFTGSQFQPIRIAFIFNNGSDSLTSPYITATPWQYFDTVFKASDNATEIKISGHVDFSFSGAKIDNISLIKLTNTSVQNYYAANNINIFPNPSNGLLQVDLKNNGDASIKIYNSIGEQMSFPFLTKRQNAFQLDLSHLSKGIYFIQIKTKQEIITEKLILTN